MYMCLCVKATCQLPSMKYIHKLEPIGYPHVINMDVFASLHFISRHYGGINKLHSVCGVTPSVYVFDPNH